MWGVSVESLLVSGCPQEIISPSEAELNCGSSHSARGSGTRHKETVQGTHEAHLLARIDGETKTGESKAHDG